ncbi:MAG: L,D-transpeptidase family protein [Actinomycetaceae bacterium]|nr:L,D-transpeptidase family protein [Actinomycetaceae bacterium]
MSRENEQAPKRVSLFSADQNSGVVDPDSQTAILPAQLTSDVPVPNDSAFTDSQENDKQTKKARKAEEKALRRKNGEGNKKKKVLIGVGIAAAVLAIAYFSGVYVYSHRFFPHTAFGALDVSNTSFEDATKLIDDTEKDYSLSVAGQGLDFVVTPAESGMDINAEQIVEAARKTMNPWTWPVQLFKKHDLVNSAEVTLDDTVLGAYVHEKVNTFNETHPASENARIEYDSASASWAIIPEVYGEQFDGEKVIAAVTSCIFRQDEECVLSEDELLKPTARADDKNVVAGAEAANNMMGVNAEFRSPVDDKVLGTLDSALLNQWITFDEDFKPSVNQEPLTAWAMEVVRPLSTVGATRSYTRPDGKQVTVSGGTFGCSVSQENAVAAVNKAIEEKASGKVALERTCAGIQGPEGSATEWEAYVDVDLSEQHARYYDASGAIVWESGVVSGNVSEGHSTPTGAYYVNNKQRNITLLGRMMPNGKREYESPVSYWMPFIGNSIGLHDASWRTADEFSDAERYRTAGSHGCVNLPSSAASSLYSVIPVGTPVIVHN